MKLQGWMVSPSPVGGKDVMSPPPTLELKGWPKLAFVHTRTICAWYTANEHNIEEQCCMNIMDHRHPAMYTQTKLSQYVLQYDKL